MKALLLALAVLLASSLASAADPIPQAAYRYRADLTRNARLAWGLSAPIATFAAQVHQESGWNPNAVSRVGAAGLAQFMPSTAKWIGGLTPDLAERQPQNPAWALRALTYYDKWLWDRISAADDCERMAMALPAYNGGLGWVYKDQALAGRSGADPQRWWGQVERYNAGRSNANFAENRGYPQRIIKTIQPRYAAWGPGVCA